jgi:hypothetical protein
VLCLLVWFGVVSPKMLAERGSTRSSSSRSARPHHAEDAPRLNLVTSRDTRSVAVASMLWKIRGKKAREERG